MVIFAMFLPLVLLMGVLSVDVGNWWVHKKRAQTLVDAAVFAAGPAFTGCAQDPATANQRIAMRALEYAGDTGRSVSTRNQQEQQPEDFKVVLNSTAYWDGDPYPLDNTLGEPCSSRFLDAKATDDDAPLLFGFIPVVADPHAHAKLEIRQVHSTSGPLPLGVREVDPARVAAIFVNEDAAASSSVVGAGWLNRQTLPQGDPLSVFNTWRGDIREVNLNGNENFGVVILTRRNDNDSLSGTLQEMCSAAQTTCYAGDSSTSGLSFIHSYSDGGSGTPAGPFVREVELAGGCGQSNPYFNVDEGVSCNAIQIQAKVDFGVAGDPTGFPTCARVTSSPGGTMTWSAGGLGGAQGTWTGNFVPAIESGRNVVDLSTQYKEPSAPGPGCGVVIDGRSFPRVAAPYVADDDSGPVQHLTIENLDPPFGFANSINGTPSANVRVTVGLIPLLKDAPLNSPPISLRIRSGSQRGQPLACDGTGAIQWKDAIVNGCKTPYYVNPGNGTCATPPDCIETMPPGDLSQELNEGMRARFASPCTPNNWDGVHLPSESDPRWVAFFITEQRVVALPGQNVLPIRRFGGFYVTAADGMDCPGDSPSIAGQSRVWGHFVSYVTPRFGDTAPSDELCTFDGAGLCTPVLVE